MLVQIAKEELDGSIQAFLSSKFEVVARISESRNVINKELLELTKHNFDSALKDLNRCHTIWRCRYEEEYGCEKLLYEKYSSSWLEDRWEEHSILDDELDEIIYSCSLPTSASPTWNHTNYSFLLSGSSALASCGLH